MEAFAQALKASTTYSVRTYSVLGITSLSK